MTRPTQEADPVIRSGAAVEGSTAFVRGVLRWGRANRRPFPWRLEQDPFRVLVAEMLLQRSRSKTVAVVYEDLFSRWPTADGLARAQTTAIRSVIRPLGLVSRAEALKGLAKEVSPGGVPDSFDALLALPGIGPYAAKATLSVAFGHRLPVVDGVSERVYRRYFGLPSSPETRDEALWGTVERVTPRRGGGEWNWAVLDLAALVCLPKHPRCEVCPVAQRCEFRRSCETVSVS